MEKLDTGGLSFVIDRGFVKNFTSHCFNCSGSGHGVTGCPYIHNQYIINERKNAFNRQAKFKKSSRYFLTKLHETTTTESSRQLFPDLTLSAQTRTAMGLGPNQLPHFIYRMRIFGYPPAYRQKCLEISQPLILQLPRGPNDHAQWGLEEESWSEEVEVWINPDFIIHFEGFNSPPDQHKIDESELYNCPTYKSVEHVHSKEAFIQDATTQLKNWVQNVRFFRQNLHRTTTRSWGHPDGQISGSQGVKRPLSTTGEDQTDSDHDAKKQKLETDDKLKGPNSTTESVLNLNSKSAGKLPQLFNFSKNYPETFGFEIKDNLDLDTKKSDICPEKCSLHENSSTTNTTTTDSINSQKEEELNNAFLESGDWTKIIQNMRKPPLVSFTWGIEEPLLLPDTVEPTGRLSKILNKIMLFKKQSKSN